jgi:hypothetical protein
MRAHRAALASILLLAGCGGGGGGSGGGSGTGGTAFSGASSVLQWLSADIGAVGQDGSDVRAGHAVTMHASGSDIWGSADSFRFLSTRL